MMAHAFDPDWVIAPGETIRECMSMYGVSLPATAGMLGLDVGEVYALLIGNMEIREYTAWKLQETFGVNRQVWLQLEYNYRRGLRAGKKDVTDRDHLPD